VRAVVGGCNRCITSGGRCPKFVKKAHPIHHRAQKKRHSRGFTVKSQHSAGPCAPSEGGGGQYRRAPLKQAENQISSAVGSGARSQSRLKGGNPQRSDTLPSNKSRTHAQATGGASSIAQAHTRLSQGMSKIQDTNVTGDPRRHESCADACLGLANWVCFVPVVGLQKQA